MVLKLFRQSQLQYCFIKIKISISFSGYNIFLLIALFVTCYFITCHFRIQRNYHEGKCFFGTVVGLLVIWAIWLICFMLMQPENRDAIVFFGIIATAYLIIFGVLIPRIYYMITHTSRRKDSEQTFDPVNPLTNLTVNTIIRQVRTLHIFSLLLIIKSNNECLVLIL